MFVGIYWQRYGWVAPDMDISGLEDELVLSSGMPRLLYVKRPAPDMEPALAEMLQRLEGEDSASYKPFRDMAELRELLVDDLALLLTERFEPAVAAPPSNGRAAHLPTFTSTFLGREAALEELGGLLADDRARLITLTGPGGTGKTRLAVEAARAEVPRFEDGVTCVDLSAEHEPDDVFATIARDLGISSAAADSPLAALQLELVDRHLLLVLDNVEQVTAAGPGIVDLLEQCPRLKVLATSREALRVTGEHLFPVLPLTLPDPTASTGIEEVLAAEAGRLFVERAQAVGSGFVLTAENAPHVAAICRHLDGLPLAVELAAAQVKLFAADELRARLETEVEVLKGGARDLPARQQTLRNTIEWSDALLTDDQRTVFRHASVFVDARLRDIDETLSEVAAVAGVDVIEALGSLVDKNLLRVELDASGRPRFSMLHTIRRYATEQLDADPVAARATRDAHAAHYTQLALDLHRPLTYVDRASVLAALSEELGNLRATWDHWVAQREVARLDELLEPLWGYYEARGDYRAIIVLGDDFLGVLAGLPESPERKHDELTLQTNLARTQLAVRGFTPEAERTMREALERSHRVGADRHRFATLRSLASLRLMRYELGPTTEAAHELMEIAAQEGDPALLSEAHLLMGVSTSWAEDMAVAIEHLDRAVESFEATRSGFVEFRVGPNPGVVAYAVSGLLGWQAGLPDTAVTRMEGAVRLARDLDHPYSLAYALHHATLLDLWRLDLESATEGSTESLHVTEVHDYPVWRALALVLHGTAAVASGQPDAGLAEIEQGFARYAELSTPPVFWPMLLMVRASAYGLAGQADRGLELIEEAAASLADGDPLEAELDAARGDLLVMARPQDTAEAEALFEKAAALAGGRGARMLELEALTSLAAIRRGRPDGEDARRRLRTVHDSFTEGFDSAPLTAARALLDGAVPAPGKPD